MWQVNVSTDPSKIKDITEGDSMIVDFTYSVKWKETTIPFEKRMEKYSRYSFLPQHLEARRTIHPATLAFHSIKTLRHAGMGSEHWWSAPDNHAERCKTLAAAARS